jgi:hypothetical protein
MSAITRSSWLLGGRSVLDQPGRKRFGRVRQKLMDEGVIAQQRYLLALER